MFIDPLATNWLDVLIERVAQLPDHVNTYLLLDGAFVPGMFRRQPFASGQIGSVHLLFESLPGCGNEVKDVSPFLVWIRDTDLSVAAKLRKRLLPCSGLPMVSAIATTENLIELGERLAAWCIVENDQQRFNFRYPDTRRLPGLYKALRDEQRAQFCGPMSFWSYIGRDGCWADIEVPGKESGIASDPVLDDEQFGVMVDDCAADEVLFRLAYRGFVAGVPHSVLYEKVSSALVSARKAGLNEGLHQEWCEYIINNGSVLDSANGIAQWQASLVDG